VTQEAVQKITGHWYRGGYYFFVEMKKRNFDVGLNDGTAVPWLVPGVCPDAQPHPCPRPTLDFAAQYGFQIDLEMHPVEFQKSKMFKSLGKEKSTPVIYPAADFPVILEHIIAEAKELYGDTVNQPILDEDAQPSTGSSGKGTQHAAD